MRNNSDLTATDSRSGGPQCSVCSHPQRAEYDRALLLETRTQADVAREIGCHRSSVSRHVSNHLLPEASAQLAESDDMAGLDIIEELEELYTCMKHHLERAEAADNWHAIRGFHAEARKDLELLARLIGELQDQPTVNILVSPAWVQTRAVILQALAPYPDARIAVAEALSDR